MILVNTLLIFAPFLDYVIVNFRENKGEGEAADDIGDPVLIGHDATNTSDDEKSEHQDFDEDAERLLLDVGGEIDGDEEEDGGDDHNVGGGEGRLAGAVGTKIEDEEFVKNEVGDGHNSERDGDEEESFINFFERFTSNPLVETEASKNRECRDGGD